MQNHDVSCPLDLAFLEEITGGDSEFAEELLTEFLNGAPLLLADLEAGLVTSNPKKVEHAAHTLKGSANAIGAKDFAIDCFAWEQAGRQADLENAALSLETLRARLDDLERFIRQRPHALAA